MPLHDIQAYSKAKSSNTHVVTLSAIEALWGLFEGRIAPSDCGLEISLIEGGSSSDFNEHCELSFSKKVVDDGKSLRIVSS